MQINNVVWTAQDIASRIDHTVLAPDATIKDIEIACDLALKHHFNAVYTNPYWSPVVAKLLAGSGVTTGISAAFPLGSLSTDIKVLEVLHTLESIAALLGGHPGEFPCAVDVVTNIGLLKEKRYTEYTKDIAAIVDAVRDHNITVKAIIETSLLDEESISAACSCAAEAEVNIVKTSTGRSGPPLLSHIPIMRAALPEKIGIKFSGFGIVNAAELALCALMLGADLLGSPCGNSIVDTLASNYKSLAIHLS